MWHYHFFWWICSRVKSGEKAAGLQTEHIFSCQKGSLAAGGPFKVDPGDVSECFVEA